MSVTGNLWDHRTTEGQPDYYSPAMALLSICGLTFLMAFFNIFRQFAGILIVVDGEPQVVPVLSPHFYEAYLPLFNIWWGLALGLQAVLLVSHRWTAFTRLADFGLALLGLAILSQVAMDGTASILAGSVQVISWLVTLLLWFILLMTAIDTAKKFVILLRTV